MFIRYGEGRFYKNYGIIFTICLIFFLCIGTINAQKNNKEKVQYPIKVNIIEKADAKYDTPENAFISFMSAYVKENSQWSDETETETTVKHDKERFKKDPQDVFTGAEDIGVIYQG